MTHSPADMSERKCWQCETGKLIWVADDECGVEDEHLVMTTMSCSDCNTLYVVYWGERKNNE
jgi:hypothetical protein